MPEQLRVVVIAASLCVACFVIALMLWRGRPRRARDAKSKRANPGKKDQEKTVQGKKEQGKADPAKKAASKSKDASTSKPEPEVAPPMRSSSPSLESLPRINSNTPPSITYEEDDEVEPTKVGPNVRNAGWVNPPTEKIIFDEDALLEEPTQSIPLILLTATAQTDRGLRRKRNEDSILAMEQDGLFVVADGMGGYRGGEVASQLAVNTIARTFESQSFPGSQHASIPRRASELARAIQAANEAILMRAQQERQLEGMGTTVCAVRFSPKKQRLYVGHVGDSRVYRLRGGKFAQMTADHTMADLGVVGEGANHLSRAVGLWPTVPIDILLGKPQAGDVYLLCSDGLTKMVKDEQISKVLETMREPTAAADELIRIANAAGGKDNVSVVVVRVELAPESAGKMKATLPN